MAPIVNVRIEGNVVAPHGGHWCAPCAVPSVVQVDIVFTLVSDPTRTIGRSTVAACTDCGRVEPVTTTMGRCRGR